ncbi:MAG: aldo/keto reductase [Bacteroidales bacterium]|nr:aldo/keto reductase [Bacteroidales bacterium]
MKLNNGYEIPSPGFGTFKIPDGDICVESVREAIAAGYTHIDTAAVYANERSVGEGIRRSGVPREKLFITSKVWNSERGYDKTLKACEKSLSDIGTDYLDLYLIHWPANNLQFGDRAEAVNIDTWRALERLVEEKVIRSAGLSNFYASHLGPVLSSANICPAADQIEYHPGLLQQETVDLCRRNGILVEAWSPLGRGFLLEDETVRRIAAEVGKTASQVLLRWCVQNDTLPLVKSVHAERIRENLDIFSFSLSEGQMKEISALPEFRYGSHPDTATF